MVRLLVALAVLFSMSNPCQADPDGDPAAFRSLIERKAAGTGVIVRLPGPKRFGVLEMPPASFASVTGIPLGSNTLETDHFKVVESMGDQALGVSDFDGRNVLYHLEQARRYFLQFDPTNPALDRKLVVRVRIPLDYNVASHFAEARLWNQSRYIWSDYRNRWGAEIWFHSPRSTWNKRELVTGIAAGAVSAAVSPTPLGIGSAAFSLATTLYRAHDGGLDAAKEPSVIEHEAFHLATDTPYPFSKNADGNPISEGLANYYACVQNGAPEVADLEEFADPKHERSFGRIHPVTERTARLAYDFTNFLPAFLWKLRSQVQDDSPEAFDREIWELMSGLGPKTNYAELSERLKVRFEARATPAGKKLFTRFEGSFRELDRVFDQYFGS